MIVTVVVLGSVLGVANGWYHLSRMPVESQSTEIRMLTHLCALVLVLAAGGLAWLVAVVAGILIGVTPFLYPVGDEAYPYAEASDVLCPIFGLLVAAGALWLLRRFAPDPE